MFGVIFVARACGSGGQPGGPLPPGHYQFIQVITPEVPSPDAPSFLTPPVDLTVQKP